MVLYCPAGDGAFEDWVERCPECGRTLVSEPPDPKELISATEDAPVVFLATLPNEPLAQLAAEVLRESGIKTLLRPTGPGFGAWGSVASFAHELYVLRSDHDEAAAILASLNEDDETPAE